MMMERSVSWDEIRNAVWNCGENKSPGPYGFSFEFFRRYWRFVGQNFDFFSDVEGFFDNGKFPKGFLLGPLSSDIQSAFVANRQILDGPFILNELLNWCKKKKKPGIVFLKSTLPRLMNSFRWEQFISVTRFFGFVPNVHVGISEVTFSSAMASILVNGSPSSEFPFFCGLKQGISEGNGTQYVVIYLMVLDTLERKIAWVSWDKVLASKKKGGLGVSSFHALNRALLLKWVWRFLSQDGSLWYRVIQALYGPSLELHLFNHSSIWCSILRENRLLNSKGFDFGARCFPSLILPLRPDKEASVASKWICDLNGEGVFRVKEIRIILDDIFLPSDFNATRWVKYIPIKVNVFAWRARLDRLPTRSKTYYIEEWFWILLYARCVAWFQRIFIISCFDVILLSLSSAGFAHVIVDSHHFLVKIYKQ
ncbi:hypothetical protein Tco_0672071 [Tanacetum coccineum]